MARASARPIPFVAPNTTTLTAGSPSEQPKRQGASNATFRIPAPPNCEELVKARLHCPELFRPRQRVLGQIDTTALGNNQFVQCVDERLRVTPHGDIERDGRSGFRKRQQAGTLRSAILDDAEKRGPATSTQESKNLRTASRPRDRARCIGTARTLGIHIVASSERWRRADRRTGLHGRFLAASAIGAASSSAH